MPIPELKISAASDALQALGECVDAHFESTGLPYVTLTYAQTLDGSIAASDGSPLAISCQEALVFTHQLRALHEAILVGIGTVLNDNPRLNTRLVEGQDPVPVILDSCLRIDQQARVLHSSRRKPIIFTTGDQHAPRFKALVENGVDVQRTHGNTDGEVDLANMLSALGKKGIRSLMVEGGSKVIASFLAEQLVQCIIVTLSLQWVNGLRIYQDPNHSDDVIAAAAMKPQFLHWAGSDLVIHGKPQWK